MMTLTQIVGVQPQQGAIIFLLPGDGALWLGSARRGGPLDLPLRLVLLKHQLELELALLPARARRGPHRIKTQRSLLYLKVRNKKRKKKKLSKKSFKNFQPFLISASLRKKINQQKYKK